MPDNIDNPQIVSYKGQIIDIRQTDEFAQWLTKLWDRQGRARIIDRLKRLANGNFGDTKPVGDGVQELRMSFGPGYRIYYMWQGEVLILLLTGGDKDRQARDIAKAKRMAKEAEDGIEDAPI